jgi:hypothetical protein
MRHLISAGPTCWGSGVGADQIRSLGRRLGPAVPGRPVHRASTGAGTSQAAIGPTCYLGFLQLAANGLSTSTLCACRSHLY